jgi:hypothetical protein
MSALQDNLGGALHCPAGPADQAAPKEPGFSALHDLYQSRAEDMRDPFDNLSMFLPISAFQEFATKPNPGFKAALNVSPHQSVLNRRISVRVRHSKIVRRIVLKSAASNFIVFESSHITERRLE